MYNNCVLSASSLTDDDVKNSEGEKLGTVKDIMICTDTQQVQYYVLSFGGFLGIGDKLFAIPPEAMQLDKDDKCFILNIDKDRLKDAEGFDKDEWPDMSDPRFRDRIYGYYGYTARSKAA